MEDQVPIIMENVFECTLEMINKDFSEFPEHRVEFFSLLRAINMHCFPGRYRISSIFSHQLTCRTALLKLDNRQFKFVIDSCMWASKHDNREVEYAGLNMCLELIINVADAGSEISNGFFQQFFIPILQDVFFVLTDTDHKAGFKSQSNLLSRMFYLVHPADGMLPKIQGPISPDQAAMGLNNKEFLGQFVGNLLQTAFPNLQPCVESHRS
jgi:exportin-1